MSKAKLGENISVDIEKLTETRMLIQANSGGGKSYAVRKLLEETHGKVQQIVLDVEGEFGTLREKYDFILAGRGLDVEVNPKSAELLARKVLEFGTSIIIDLYELKAHDRSLFVRNFVDALVNSPKELWHPVLVLIDEAHIFAPEKGESQAASAVIDLATRGRKRGFACVLATQRLSKLNKDVAAECLNKLIGRTSLDIDRKRASDELGFTSQRDSLNLRSLKPGQFYAFGPAIGDEPKVGTIDRVETTHPKAGQRIGSKAPKPTSQILSVLKKLTDLPKEAEAELKDRDQMRLRIQSLERDLKTAQKTAKIETRVEQVIDEKSIKKAISVTKKEMIQILKDDLDKFSKEIRGRLAEFDGPALSPPIQKITPTYKPSIQPVNHAPVEIEGRVFGACERKILGFLSIRPGEYFSKVQVGAMTGYSHGSGGFNNALSNLGQAGLILRRSGDLSLNPSADVSGLVDQTPHRLEDWISKLGACERKIYEHLLSNPDDPIQKDTLGGATGYSSGSGGFNNALSRLNTLGLIIRESGCVRLNPEVVGL